MVGLVLQEVDLLRPFLVLDQLPVLDLLLQDLLLLLELLGLLLQVVPPLLQLLDLRLQLGRALLRLQLLPHGEGERALVQGLIGLDGHVQLVAHPHQQDAPLGRVDGHLPDDLVEALVVQLLAYGADARVPGLAVDQLLVQQLLQGVDILPRGRVGADGLLVVLALGLPGDGREHRVQQFYLSQRVQSMARRESSSWLAFLGLEPARLSVV